MSPLSDWESAEGVVLISPVMQGPRFVQYLVHGSDGCKTTGSSLGIQRLVYVLEGEATIGGNPLKVDDFAWFPPEDSYELLAPEGCKLLVFEKDYEPLEDVEIPNRTVGSLSKASVEPFMGDENAMLATLLPVEQGFDMAVNVFNFQPGTTLPLVETHVMEHGLYMKEGQGIYRLDESWYPVQKGDSIWMASYCPQWFVAMGKSPAAYIYYKDIHRHPLNF